MRRIEAAGGNIAGGRLVSGLQLDSLTGDVSAVVSRDRSGNETVHPADAVVFAIGISGDPSPSSQTILCSERKRANQNGSAIAASLMSRRLD